MEPLKDTLGPSKYASTWYRCPGIVYFFGAGTPAVAIKIGVTAITTGKLEARIRRRQEHIQSANHELIELLGVIRCPDMIVAEERERDLHFKFAALQRFKAHTRGAEWFTPAPELVDYIRENAETPEALAVPRTVGLQINR
jgi:hypothetical protein